MKIYNHKTKRKEVFKTINKGEFKLYVCGITPHDSPHIGHIIVALRFNIIRNYLHYKGYKGTFVQNITDIDDKIIDKAINEGVSLNFIASRYTKEYEQSLSAFNIKKPDFNPKVTEYVDKIIIYINNLIKKGYAYATDKGNVYFDVSKKTDYGKLSNKKLDELQNKVSKDKQDKNNYLDFALWKSEKNEEFSWPSPWGRGRPGWHIECSVMSNDILGKNIDIHGGGIDLNFPHHENELAQCEAHNNHNYVNYWMYSGLLNVDGVKMSKSLGNFITANDGLNKYGAELLIYVTNTYQYRSDINFQDRIFIDNLNNIANFHKAFILVKNTYNTKLKIDNFELKEVKLIVNEFFKAMDEDFNTARALVSLNKLLTVLINEIKYETDEKRVIYIYKKIINLGNILNLFFYEDSKDVLNELFKFYSDYLNKPRFTLEKLNDYLEKMKIALNNKNYSLSDNIRNNLLDSGIKVMQKEDKNIEWQFAVMKND